MRDMNEKGYLDLAAHCVERATALGAEWCDAVAGRARDIDVVIEKSGIKSADAGQGESVAVRCYVRGGMGYGTVSGRDRRDVDEAVERAVELAREATPDPDFRRLPDPAPVPEVPDLFDEAVAGLGVEDVVKIAAANLETGRAVEGDALLAGHVGLTVSEGALASSTGIRLTKRGTRVDASIEATLRREDDTGYFYDFDYGRHLADCDLARVAERATAGARRYLGARRIGSKRMTLVLGPLAASALLDALVDAADAEAVQRGRSYLTGKPGKTIASEHLSVSDDALVPRGMHSGPFDGEGTPRRRLAVIDGGVLVGLLHNSYTAGKAGTESTGHGTHSGGIRSTNVLPELGHRPARELLAEVEEGIYLEAGEIRPDEASGDLSAAVDFGFAVRQGVLEYPVENAMLGTTVFELLERLDAVSSDARLEPGAVMPTLRIQDVQIAGTE